MELRGLARKQKRLKDWTQFLESAVKRDEIRVQMTETLKLYRNLLAKVWESEAVSEEEDASIQDLERKLDQLAGDARLEAQP